MGKKKINQDAELMPSCPQREERSSAIRNGQRARFASILKLENLFNLVLLESN